MYYAVLRKEIKFELDGGVLTQRVGGVYQVAKSINGVKYRSIDTYGFLDDSNYGEPCSPWREITTAEAQEHFTTPVKDNLDGVIEESFLVCEAAYC